MAVPIPSPHFNVTLSNLATILVYLVFIIFASGIYAETITYHYDALGRLVKVDSSDFSSQSYQLDPAGNRISVGKAEDAGQNSPPIAVNDAIRLRSHFSEHTLNVIDNDVDADKDRLVLQFVGSANNLFIEAISPTTLSIMTTRFVSGSTSFSYKVSDGRGGVDEARVTVHFPSATSPFMPRTMKYSKDNANEAQTNSAETDDGGEE